MPASILGEVESPWTPCHACRRDYAGLLHRLRNEYGYRVSRKIVTDRLQRGKLFAAKRMDGSDGYREFNVRKVLAMAMGADH